jgi:hypothetical protein
MLQMETPERPKGHDLQNTVTQQLHDFSSKCTVIICISEAIIRKALKVLLSCFQSVAALK